MSHKPIRSLLLPALLATLLLVTYPAVAVYDIRLGEHEAYFRLVIESSDDLQPRIEPGQDYLHIHLNGADADTLNQQLAIANLHRHPLIEASRSDRINDSASVLALDLSFHPEATLSTLQPHGSHGFRTVVDIRRPTLDGRQTAPGAQPAGGSRPSSVPLQDLRIGHHPDRTRLVIETAATLHSKLSYDAAAKRLSLELDSLDLSSTRQALDSALNSSRGLIAQARVTESAAGRNALVLELDLKEAATHELFNLKPGDGHSHRLVLDLTPRIDAPPASEATGRERPRAERARDERPTRAVESDLLWVEARINQLERRHSLLALVMDDEVFLNKTELDELQLHIPGEAHLRQDGETWFSLGRLGIDFHLDPQRLTLELTVPPRMFAGRTLQTKPPGQIEATPSPPGAFLNYDLTATHSDRTTTGSGLFELAAFNGWGIGTSSAIARHSDSSVNDSLVRLDTQWRRDHPASRRTLLLGDSVTQGTRYSGNVRFGGLSWGTNFELQPELVTMPLISMAGEATLPSTVEVYINDALRLRETVEPGPFDIDQIPVVTGSGQASLVITDMLGRQQVIARDFYASQSLLRRGLHDWNVALGAVREDYGLEDFAYGAGFAAATHRYGLSDRLTGTLHAHVSESHGQLGSGADWLIPGGGLASVAVASSLGDDADGWFYSLGLQRQGRRWSGGIEGQFTHDEFTRLGMGRGQPLPSQQLRAFLSTSGSVGSLSLSYTGQSHAHRDDIEFLTLRFSRRLGWGGLFNLSAAHYLDHGDNALTASFSIPLSQPRTSARLAASWREDNQFATLGLRRNLPAGPGLGYDLQMRAGDGEFQRGAVFGQGDRGSWRLEGSHLNERFSTRAQAAGGLAFINGRLLPSRTIQDGFALVEVADIEGVRVYADNQFTARTDARGHALVPRLRPYQRNRIRIDQADLPLDARIDALELEVAPYWRSGVVLSFPVSRSRDAFFRILREDGRPIPAGAQVYDRHGDAWAVGHRGETFIAGLDERNHLEVRFGSSACEFELIVADNNEPLPDLGSVTCLERDR